MGAERKSLVMTEEEKCSPPITRRPCNRCPQRQGDRPVHKATSSPRPRSRHGHAASRARQALHESRADDFALAIMMGGRVAENWCSAVRRSPRALASDIEQATNLPHDGHPLGPVRRIGQRRIWGNQEEVFLGIPYRGSRTFPNRPPKIDSEIRRLVEAGYSEANAILKAKRDELELLARGSSSSRRCRATRSRTC